MKHLLKMYMRSQVQFPALEMEGKRKEGEGAGKRPVSALSNSSMKTGVSHYCVTQSAGH